MAASQGRDSVFRMTLQGAERRYWFDYGDLANFTFAAPPDKFSDGRGGCFSAMAMRCCPVARACAFAVCCRNWTSIRGRNSSIATRATTGGSAKQLLSGADFKVGKLTGFGQQFDQVNLQLDRKPSAWGLQFDSQQAKGTVNLSDAKGAPIAVNLRYVKLPAVDPTVQADENAPDPLADIDPKEVLN